MRTGLRGGIAAIAAISSAILTAAPAEAGGLYYADRGVRPLSRGGAFVAGADDAGAFMYNPAGMFDAGGQVLIDAAWVHFTSDYTRQAVVSQIDPNTRKPVGSYVQTFDTVSGKTPFLPIPTIAVTIPVHKQVTIGFGAWAPYAALTTYPETVNGKPAPQRYSLISLDGSALAFVGAGLAVAPIKELRIGATFGMLTGVFNTKVAFGGCVPDALICAPEQPSWDVLSQLSVGPIIAPTGSFGLTYVPHPAWRIGAAVQLPVYVRSKATLKTRLPSSPTFDGATQEGDTGRVSFDLPWGVRAGIETRAVENLRLEVAFNYDRWKMHDNITLTPDGIALKNVAGFPQTYYIPEVVIPRNFQDSVAVHVGGEYSIKGAGLLWDVRAGVAFETSAVPTNYESVLTIDQNKLTTALGGSLHWRKVRLDVTYAHVFGFTVNVDPQNAQIAMVSPVSANLPKNPSHINGGTYAARADVIGLGMAYTFDPAPGREPLPVAPPAK